MTAVHSLRSATISVNPRAFLLSAVAGGFLLASPATQAQTFYWDTNGGTGGVGGTGTWQNTAGNWSTDIAGTLPTTWDNANRNIADFRGTAGTVTVSGGVTAGGLIFNAGEYTLEGGTITVGRGAGTGAFTAVRYQAGTGTNSISNDIVIDDVGTVGSSDQSYIFRNDTTSTLVLDGDLSISYGVGVPAGTKIFSLQGINAASVITLNGSILAPVAGTSQRLQINGASGATYYINGDNALGLTNGTGGQIVKGTVYLGHDDAMGNNPIQIGVSSTFGSDTAALLTDGERTVSNNLSLGGANASSQLIVGGGSAHDSTFSGNFNVGSAAQNLRMTAVAGGRTDFSGNITGGGTGLIIKQGDGVVGLTRAAGNGYTRNTEVHAGTLLLMNTSNSATGSGTVTVADGAALGGAGSASGAVTASAAGSIFTAGDMTKEGVSAIGELTLSGGLTADNGATFKFDLDGAAVDLVDFGAGNLSFDGTVTFDFVSLGTVNTGVAYSLFDGSGTWDGSGANFVFESPDGYVLDSSYGGGDGYIWDEANHSLTVQFAVVPEPSAALLVGAGLALVLWRSGRRVRAC